MLYKYLILLTLNSLTITINADESCDAGWQAYKDETCYKILDETLLNFQKAIEMCAKQGEGGTLPIIHSKDEQDFLATYLYVNHTIANEVWIGARVDKKVVTWIDGTKGDYTNWKTGSPSSEPNECVQVDAEKANQGKWEDVACAKDNQVVCQKPQLWTRDHMQHELVNTRKELDDLIKNLDNKIQAVSIPIGFIYVQLQDQPEPHAIWPTIKFDDVTSAYAGVFFRAEGGDSQKFGSGTQLDDSPRLADISFKFTGGTSFTDVSINPGTWSPHIISGGHDGDWVSMSFLVKSVEVRPKNQAVRIWKRSS